MLYTGHKAGVPRVRTPSYRYQGGTREVPGRYQGRYPHGVLPGYLPGPPPSAYYLSTSQDPHPVLLTGYLPGPPHLVLLTGYLPGPPRPVLLECVCGLPLPVLLSVCAASPSRTAVVPPVCVQGRPHPRTANCLAGRRKRHFPESRVSEKSPFAWLLRAGRWEH